MAWSKKGFSSEQLAAVNAQKGKKSPRPRRASYIKADVPMFVPRQGENCIRILEPREADTLGHWAMQMHFHRNVGPNRGDWICNLMMAPHLPMIDVPVTPGCPECAMQTSELWDSDPDLAKTYYSDRRRVLLVLDLYEPEDSPKYGEVLLWSCPWTLHEDILAQSNKKGQGGQVFVDVSNPETGPCVYFDRIGEKKETKYRSVQLGDEAYPLDEYYDEARPWFKDLFIFPSYEMVVAAQEGQEVLTAEGSWQPGENDEPGEVGGPTGELCPGCGGELYDSDVGPVCAQGCVPEEAGEEEVPPASETVERVTPNWPEDMPADQGYEDCFTVSFDEFEECTDCTWRDTCDPNQWPEKPKAAPKKAPPKAAPKKAAAKKAAPKKAPPKAAPKKAPPKAAPKKAAPKTAPGKTAGGPTAVAGKLAAAIAARKKAGN